MNQLDQALTEHMANIVFLEHRPFSFLDFLPQFEVNGKVYCIEYGTLRNKFSKSEEKRRNQSWTTGRGRRSILSRVTSSENTER